MHELGLGVFNGILSGLTQMSGCRISLSEDGSFVLETIV